MAGNEDLLKNCSEIIDSIVSTKGQYYRQETGKEEVKSLKFGTGSSKGSLKLVLNKKIDAIGFYAEAYQSAKDQTDKTLTVNDIETKNLDYSYTYDLNNENQRFFIEFPEETNEVTISASIINNNRFYLYSIGFYSKHNFPDAPVAEKYTISFDANGGTGTMNPVQVQEGSSYTLPSCDFTAPSGYEFDYWSIGDTKQTKPIIVNSNITLKANWKEKATPTGEVIITSSDITVINSSTTGYTRYNGTRTSQNIVIESNQVMPNNGKIQFQAKNGYIILHDIASSQIDFSNKTDFTITDESNGVKIARTTKNAAYIDAITITK